MSSIRQFCASLRGATFDIKWENHYAFCVGAKMFAITSLPKTDEFRLSFKCTPETALALIELDSVEPMPYLAKHHWVVVRQRSAVEREDLEGLIRESYDLIFAKLTKAAQKQIRGL